MKGVIFDIKRFAVHDGPGIRTTVFFKGCPLKCSWCHNPEGRDKAVSEMKRCFKIGGKEIVKNESVGREISVKDLIEELLKDYMIMEESEGGVTISGGEPLLQYSFLINVLKGLKHNGIHTCLDTTGYSDENKFIEVIPHTDLFLYDLKHYDNEKHITETGVQLNPIVNNLDVLSSENKKFWIRIPVIPNVNDSHEDKYGFLYFLQNLKSRPEEIHLLAFHNIAHKKYENLNMNNEFIRTPNTEIETLIPFKEMLERNNFNVKIGG